VLIVRFSMVFLYFFGRSRASLIKRARVSTVRRHLCYMDVVNNDERISTFPLTSRSSPGRTPQQTPLAGRRSALADP